MEFNFIADPVTGKNHSIYNNEGRRILANYVHVNKQMVGAKRKATKKRNGRKERGKTAYCKMTKERTPRNSNDQMKRCRRSRGRRNKRCKRGDRGHCRSRRRSRGGSRSRSKKRNSRKSKKSKKSRKSKKVSKSIPKRSYDSYFI